MKLFTVTLAALALSIPVFAAPAEKPAKQMGTFPTKCVVTGETIKSEKDAVGKSVYQGKTYYFCCSACKPEFDKNPAKYAKPTVKP